MNTDSTLSTDSTKAIAPSASPTMSLIISTLGRSKELEVLLESLARQTFKDFEVIIVDQNQDDRLLPVIGTARWPYPIRRIHTPTQKGLSLGRNAGLQAAKGSIILFPDDDCWYSPEFLSKGLQLLHEHGCAGVTGRAADETGRSINGRFEMMPQWIDRHNVWTTQIEWVAFFRKEALMTVNGYDENIGIGAATHWQANEGHDLTLRLLSAGFRSYYDPSLYGFHAELNTIAPDAAMIHKGRGYARGFGYVLKLHHYSAAVFGYWLLRPAVKCLLCLIKGDSKQARYYMNVTLGRLEGWRGKIFTEHKNSGGN